MKTALTAVIAALLMALALSVGAGAGNGNGNGQGHTPVTICHKPGTPAENTLTVDDDAVPAHLAHGDYLGACQPPVDPPVDPEDPPVTPPADRCPPGMTPTAGKDGAPGNDECEFPQPLVVTPDNPCRLTPGKAIPRECFPPIIEPCKPTVIVKTKVKIKKVKVVVVKWKTRVVTKTKVKVVKVFVGPDGRPAVRGSG